MNLLLTVFNVAPASETDVSIGLYNGNLRWSQKSATVGGVPYIGGFFSADRVSGLNQSATNIATGGTYTVGFTDAIRISFVSLSVQAAIASDSIAFGTNTVLLQAEEGGDIATLFQLPLTVIEPKDEIESTFVIEPANYFDQKKLPSTVITKEMALNVEDSEIIGETIVGGFGNNVLYKLHYCDVSKLYSAFTCDPTGTPIFQIAKDVIGHPPDPIYNVATEDLAFMRGLSLMQCVGVWQSTETEYVWVALSYNGRDLLFDVLVAPTSEQQRIRSILTGRYLRDTFGDKSYCIQDVEWAEHTVAWDGYPARDVDITTLWVQLNTTKKDDFTFVPPTWNEYGNGDGSVMLHTAPMFNPAKCAKLVGPLKAQEFFSGVTYFSFLSNSTSTFLLPAEANLVDAIVYEKSTTVDGLNTVVTADITVAYKTFNWQLITIAANELDGDTSTLKQMSVLAVPSYAYENEDTIYSGHMNALVYDNGTVDTAYTDGQVDELVSIPSNGINFTNPGSSSDADRAHSVNTYYIKAVDVVLPSEAKLTLVPDILVDCRGVQLSGYSANLHIELFAIGESNIAIDYRHFQTRLHFDGEICTIHIDTEYNTVRLSDDCTTYDTNSVPLLYSQMADMLSFDMDRLQTHLLNGFLVVVSILYDSNSVVPLNIHMFSKIMKPVKCTTSKGAKKKDLYIKCQQSTSYVAPVDIASSMATLCGVPIDVDSFSSTRSAQAAFLTSTYSGSLTPESAQSLSDALDVLARQSLTVFYLDAVGILHARFLPSVPTSVSHEFGNPVKDSASFAMPRGGYLYSDFDFLLKTTDVGKLTTLSVDTDAAESFPASDDYPVGDIIFDTAHGYTVSRVYQFEDLFWMGAVSIYIHGSTSSLSALFLAGTMWQIKVAVGANYYTVIARLDSVAPDLQHAQYGIQALFAIQSTSYVVGTGGDTLRLYGPVPTWRNLVSGVEFLDYTEAQSVWNRAKNARALLGFEQKMPTSVTQMTQPIWGADWPAITSWTVETVRYGATRKLVIRFSTEISVALLNVHYMSYVTFSFGPYANVPVNGYICERNPDFLAQTIAWTILCLDGSGDALAVLTEAGLPVDLEGGGFIEIENGDSLKISEMVVVTTDAALSVASSIPIAYPVGATVTNARIYLGDLVSTILEQVSGTLDHSLLTNRDAVNQHPTSSITGLDEALASKISGSGIINYLSKFTAVNTIGACRITDDGTNVITPDLTVNALLADRAVGADASKRLVSSATTLVELAYLSGVTGSVQTQLNGKAPTSHASNGTTYGIASSTNYGHAKSSTTNPLMDGTASAGTAGALFSNYNHVHPTDTSRAAVGSVNQFAANQQFMSDVKVYYETFAEAWPTVLISARADGFNPGIAFGGYGLTFADCGVVRDGIGSIRISQNVSINGILTTSTSETSVGRRWIFQPYTSGGDSAALYNGAVEPSNSNYALYSSATATELNATTLTSINVANISKLVASSSLITTSVPVEIGGSLTTDANNATAAKKWKLMPRSGGASVAAMYNGGVTPDAQNYALGTTATSTELNAPTGVSINVNDAYKVRASSTQVTVYPESTIRLTITDSLTTVDNNIRASGSITTYYNASALAHGWNMRNYAGAGDAAALYNGAITSPSGTNYALYSTAISTQLNAVTSVYLSIADETILQLSATAIRVNRDLYYYAGIAATYPKVGLTGNAAGGSEGGIFFGSGSGVADCSIYRSATNTLTTADSFEVAGILRGKGATVIEQSLTLSGIQTIATASAAVASTSTLVAYSYTGTSAGTVTFPGNANAHAGRTFFLRFNVGVVTTSLTIATVSGASLNGTWYAGNISTTATSLRNKAFLIYSDGVIWQMIGLF